ncbi:MAG: hypothetical protein KC656_17050, partial [Myxococcales bacterium]|nr:hypothetical protein [Myxococcales bacterium]
MTTLDDLEPFIKAAQDEGALGVELLRETVTGNRIVRGAGKPEASTFGHDVLTVRVWVAGGRLGVMRGDPADAMDLVGQALASTFESPEDALAGPVGRMDTPSGALSVRDRRYDRLDADGRIEVVDDVRAQLKDRRFEPGPIVYEDALRRRTWLSSKGGRLTEEDTWFRVEAGLTGKGLDLHQHTASRSFASVASLPLGTNLVQRADALHQKGRTLPPGPV